MTSPTAVDVPALLDQQKVGCSSFVVGLCALVVMLDGFDIQSIGYVAPAVAQDLHLSYAQLSRCSLRACWALTIGALICGPLADWFGRRIMIIVGTLFFCRVYAGDSDGGIGHQLDSPPIRFPGWASAALMPNAIALTSEFCPHRRHGTMVIG